MKNVLLSIAAFFFTTSIYTYTIPDTNGEPIAFANFQGKKILIVNTAGGSEFVDQYASLEQLYQIHKDSLVIIVVPSNSFGNEQGTDSTIFQYVTETYGATYVISGKAEVKGVNQVPLYHWLTNKSDNGQVGYAIHGDWQKFLIDKNGKIIGVFAPSVDPMSDELQDAIKNVD
ncbi:glutathione peroxidase [Limnovirga soli]|uniref:Glutathione peroxidase n=1 Tax=Limnovirga soli TaxID=2656915 RepID=A0A8J8FC95_9BACT|nr:glutathione peroxidase [Limnovirga soli]NNV55075.1 glutathione peroxidase [Limnovirga soli]